MSNHDLVTTAEAVHISGRSRFALYRLVKQGLLRVALKAPATTGGYFFERADIEALASSQAVPQNRGAA